MTEGTSQGLFIVVAIVIFGIFVSLSYTLFGKTLQPQLGGIFNEVEEQITYKMNTSGSYNPKEADDVVYIQDIDLQRAIKDELGIPKSVSLTLKDIQEIKHLEANVTSDSDGGIDREYSDLSVSSLNGLEYAENLEELWLHGNEVSDLKPLEDLTQLRVINFNFNKKNKDLTPLKNLVNLERVYIDENKITDLGPLKEHTKLTTLNISKNDITNINDLYKLKNLTHFYFRDTDISDVSMLKDFNKLIFVDARYTKVKDFTPLNHVLNVYK